ncbi:MAG TPA: UDP-N-acetylmuramoyl-tripeptide--D-alanyl-D-alanine ligase [Desulfotomaculum sp.]|nr:UDP-N-acetylmuramoyl-tripeptide--D-alanyl-D-alanine ligase [Desulfotomaculum sp.]
MKIMTIEEIARVTGATILQGDPRLKIENVSIDTRHLKKGSLFFALKGERYDAHDFLRQAVAAGAACVVVARHPGFILPAGLVCLKVPDPKEALQKLARYNRQNCPALIVGITGSMGKTTTKDILATLLAEKLVTLKNNGNLNNEIGLPLTLLELNTSHQVGVVEMAMRGPGEIDFLCRLANPDGAIITNIGVAHLERLGSQDNLARAKGEILNHIPQNGFAVLNGESPYIYREARRTQGKVLFFALRETLVGQSSRLTDILAFNLKTVKKGTRFTVRINDHKITETEIYLPLPGRHNVLNALAAIGAAKILGLSLAEIQAGLTKVTTSKMRLEIYERNGLTIINDTYNANPDSVLAALEVLNEVAGQNPKIAVLGDMLELGSYTFEGHQKTGGAAAASNIQYLVTVGELALQIAVGASAAGMPKKHIFTCRDNDEAVSCLRKILVPGSTVLIKGSRLLKMEEIANKI